MKFKKQKLDTTCFPVAIINCGVYLDVDLNLNKYIDICNCETGGAMHINKAIKKSKLPLIKTLNINKVFKNGGILNIMHPIFNLHAIFIYPEGERIICINSWLGPNIMKIHKNELKKFITMGDNSKTFFYIKKLIK